MKKLLILILAAGVLLSGCVDKTAQTVKKGDNISVNYVGSFENGTVFDTSIESVAKTNGLFTPGATYEPLNFTVGKKSVIEGFDEGVVGMKVGETKKLTIPPEKAYPVNPGQIYASPIIIDVPVNNTVKKGEVLPLDQFEQFFGENHTVGESLQIPNTNINITINNISSEVSFTYDFKLGSNVWDARAPWNQTVIKIDEKNITLRSNVKKNQVIQEPGYPFTTTVTDINDTNITLRRNPIPDTTVELPSMFGQMIPTKISFNETSVIFDQNPEVAGKTLIFNVTLVSIDK
ncbi:MAG: FKBP-type peptidyl-prolyl cis-trans isomerase [Candidatus Methanoperedens sp.]|nr:FKBP-type peptidyl-prolyl cis-trans isomerase [Candidatus Methanoperedens sp.]